MTRWLYVHPESCSLFFDTEPPEVMLARDPLLADLGSTENLPSKKEAEKLCAAAGAPFDASWYASQSQA